MQSHKQTHSNICNQINKHKVTHAIIYTDTSIEVWIFYT